MRVENILLNTRDVLADHSKQRWTDDTLIRLFNQGLKSFVMQAKTLKQRSYLPVEVNTAIYDMSPYSLYIDRIEYMHQVLEGKTEEQMDRIEKDWPLTVGDKPKFVVFDNLKQGVFRIYPKVVDGAINNVNQNQPYGILIDIEVTDDLLMVPQIDDIAFQGRKFLVVFYIGKPREVTIETEDEDLDIQEHWDDALVAYISGQALRLDADTLNRQFGAEQLGIFNSYVAKATIGESEANNTFVVREIPYKGFV